MLQHERYYSTGDDPLYFVFKYIRILIATLVIEATLIQIMSKQSNPLFISHPELYLIFLLISGIYICIQLTIGILFLKDLLPEYYIKTSLRLTRFVVEMIICSSLLFLARGSFEYFLLFFPGLIMFNLYLSERSNGRQLSFGISIIIALLYFIIQYKNIQTTSSYLHYSSTVVKSLILIGASFFSYWFWKGRKANWKYLKSIELLNGLGDKFTSATSSKEVLEGIVKDAAQVLEADIVQITSYDIKTKCFQIPFVYGQFIDSKNIRSEIQNNDIHFDLIKEERDIFVSDTRRENITARTGKYQYIGKNSKPFVFREKIKSSVGVRLIIGNEILGVMLINYRTRREFLKREKQIIYIFANFAALSIKNIKEKENLVKRINTSIQHISDIKKLPSGSQNEKESYIINLVLHECLDLLKADLGYFSIHNLSKNTLTIIFSSPKYKSQIGLTYSTERGLTGLATRTGATQVMNIQGEIPEYEKFGDISESEYKTNIDENVKSAMAIPLRLEEEVIGVYLLESDQENGFSELDVRILKSLVILAAISIKNIRLLKDSEESTTFLKELGQIDKNIVRQPLELTTVLDMILKKAMQRLEGSVGSISLKKSEKELVISASTLTEDIGTKLSIEDSLSGVAVLEGRTVYIPNLNDERREYRLKNKPIQNQEHACVLAIPLRIQNECIGVLNIESNELGKFTQKDITTVETFAGQATVAIHIAQLYKDNNEKREILDTLRRIDKMILTSISDLPTTLDIVWKETMDMIHGLHGEIWLLDEKKENLRCERSSLEEDRGKVLAINECICGKAILEEKTIYVRSVDEEPLYKVPYNGRKKSELVVPLLVNKKPIGVINIECEISDEFEENDIKVLEDFADVVAVAIKIALTIIELEKANDRLIEIDNTVFDGMNNFIVERFHELGNKISFIGTEIRNLPLKDIEKLSNNTRSIIKNVISRCDAFIKLVDESQFFLEQYVKAEKVNLNIMEIIEECILEYNFAENIIQIETDIANNLRLIRGSRISIKSIIQELLNNSIDALPDGGKIKVVAHNEDNSVVLIVEDNGIGIPKDIMDHLYNVGHSTKKNHKGLGLFSIYMMVKTHRGHIFCDPNIVKGTVFKLSFPAVA